MYELENSRRVGIARFSDSSGNGHAQELTSSYIACWSDGSRSVVDDGHHPSSQAWRRPRSRSYQWCGGADRQGHGPVEGREGDHEVPKMTSHWGMVTFTTRGPLRLRGDPYPSISP